MQKTFLTILSWQIWPFLEIIDRDFTRDYLPVVRYAPDIWSGGYPRDMGKLRQGYLDYYAHIRDKVPQEQL